MQVRKLVIITALSLALLPSSAFAQNWFFTPFVGGNFGGNAAIGDLPDGEDEIERRIDFGGTVGWSPSMFGFEIDFGYTPNFFEDTAGDRNFEFGDSNVTTIMGNLLLSAPPDMGIRPYASAGLGLMRANISSASGLFNDVATNDLAVNVGAGINGQFSDRLGLRGDVRYFRSLQDNVADNDFDLDFGGFEFWRGTVGLTFRW